MAPFEMTERKAVAAIGEPSYTSAVHKWKGTMDNLNAKAVNKFEIEVYCEYNSEWVAYQQMLLQVENRATRDAQFEYKSSRRHTEFYLDEHIHDLLVADPFK